MLRISHESKSKRVHRFSKRNERITCTSCLFHVVAQGGTPLPPLLGVLPWLSVIVQGYKESYYIISSGKRSLPMHSQGNSGSLNSVVIYIPNTMILVLPKCKPIINIIMLPWPLHLVRRGKLHSYLCCL